MNHTHHHLIARLNAWFDSRLPHHPDGRAQVVVEPVGTHRPRPAVFDRAGKCRRPHRDVRKGDG